MLGKSGAVSPADRNLIYAGGYSGLFFKSTDAGSSWSLSNTGLSTAYYVYDIAPHPTNTNIIYLATSNGVYKTTNGGTNWAVTTLTGTVNDVLVHPRGPDTVYAGASGGFYKSVNSGATWTAMNGGLINTYVTSLVMNKGGLRADSSFIFAGTQGGGMHRMFLSIIPVEEQKTGTPRICFAITPNPARDRARFQYAVDHPGRVEIKIYDPLGRLVEALVDGPVSAGNHYADWNCLGRAAGVYFVKLVSGESKEVRKLILVD